jgi:Ca2+-binding RTX toxin-like protein
MPTPIVWKSGINFDDSSFNNRPHITALADGRFVVAWCDNTNDVVRAQILNADGSARGSSFVLSKNTSSGAKEVPAICALKDGKFVAVWTEQTDPGSNNPQGGKADVVARIFEDGAPVGDEIQVSGAAPTNYLFRPAITATDDGFAVSWSQYNSHPNSSDNNVLVTSYDSSGRFVDGEVFTTTNYEFPKPAITTLEGGKQVVVWVNANSNGTTTIRAAIGSDGSFNPVDIATGPDFFDPQVTKLVGGGFVVTWEAENQSNGIDDAKVMAQVFNAAGQPVSINPIDVSSGSYHLGENPDPVVTALRDGRFAVAWADRAEQSGLHDIKVQVFSVTGAKDGNPLLVSPPDATNDYMPTISTLEDGRIVLSWWHDALPEIMTQIIDPREAGINLVDSGSTNDDHIGTNFGDTMDGGAGHDQIRAQGGNDSVHGGDGNDTLNGANGDDWIAAENDNDKVDGGDGNDTVGGQDGTDTVLGGAGNDHVYGGLGHDTLDGGSGDDRLVGDEDWPTAGGNDSLTGGLGQDALIGGSGNDTLNGGAGVDTIRGGADNDVYHTTAGDVVIEEANQGTDKVVASSDWTLSANVENLDLSTAARGVGNDLANIINGSGGNDVLVGGGGADTLRGGAGDDVYYIDGSDVIVDSSGFDTVHTAATVINLDVYAQMGIEQVFSTSAGPITINGGQQANTLTGTGNNDVLTAGNANDVLNGGSGADNMSGGGGSDIMNGGVGADRMAGGTGDDVYYVHDAGDQVVELAGQGRDSVFTSVSFALGGNEVENLTATGNARINLTGSAHANTLVGNAGKNTLKGGSGNDKLSGGLGQDTLWGQAGRDKFVFDDRDTGSSKGRADTIMDFSGRGGDRLDLRAVDANTKRGGDQNFSFIGTKGFSKAGEVRYEKAGRDTYVYLNTDNDKSAEAVIKLKGAMDLQKGWFVL